MNRMINNLTFYTWRIFEKMCERHKAFRFLFTSQGLKNINLSLLSFQSFTESTFCEINPSELYIGADYLKDDYTLLGCCITDSPHAAFQQCVIDGENLSETDYLKRTFSGRLDWRRLSKDTGDYSFYIHSTDKTKREVEENSYSPVIVYQVSNRYYIYDGKHRASMCAVLGKMVRCRMVNASVAFDHHWRYMFGLVSGKKGFEKHISFYHSYLNQNNG